MIGLINYDGGNFRSVSNVLEYLGIKFIEINDYKKLNYANHIILPGVGSYDYVISKLKSKNLFYEIRDQVITKKKLFLGICVGMQILSTKGLENSTTNGFNLIDGIVRKIPVKNNALPNIGWHKIIKNKESLLFRGIDESELLFYFVHSYHFELNNQQYSSSKIYYESEITSSVEDHNIYGVQFHPEKSQSSGLRVIKNFCNL